MKIDAKLAEILLVEDSEGDIELTKEAFNEAKFRNNLSVAEDGDVALDFLFKRNLYADAATPDIILLDLNLPCTDGREVLEIIKSDINLKNITVIVLISSKAEKDVIEMCELYAYYYLVKPIDAEKLITVIRKIENFWIDIVCSPGYSHSENVA